MNKRHYEHTLPNIRGSLSNTYGLTAETRTIVPVDGLHFHFPCNYGFPLIFRIVFRRSHHHFPMQR